MNFNQILCVYLLPQGTYSMLALCGYNFIQVVVVCA